MAIDPVTGQVILGAASGIMGGLSQDKQGLHNRYMDRRQANMEDFDRRGAYERRKARSPGSSAILQQLAQRLGLQMPDEAFRGSQERAPMPMSGKYMPGDPKSGYMQAYGPPPAQPELPPPPDARPRMPIGAEGQGGLAAMLRAYLGQGGR